MHYKAAFHYTEKTFFFFFKPAIFNIFLEKEKTIFPARFEGNITSVCGGQWGHWDSLLWYGLQTPVMIRGGGTGFQPYMASEGKP